MVHNHVAYDPDTNPNPGHGAGNDIDIVYETRYDDLGRRTQLIDAKGHSTWFEYDAFGRLYRKILDNDGDGNKEPGSPDSYEKYTYDSGRGLLTKKRNFDGSRVEYAYDPPTDRRTEAKYCASGGALERTEVLQYAASAMTIPYSNLIPPAAPPNLSKTPCPLCSE